MRKMGIDYGTKRVGIALTDEGGQMAFPHSVLANDAALRHNIETLIAREGVGEIVIGHSKNLDGSDNDVQTAIEALMMDLTLSVGLPIYLEPEQFTSQEAKRIQGKNAMLDASAAAIILNSYLNKQR